MNATAGYSGAVHNMSTNPNPYENGLFYSIPTNSTFSDDNITNMTTMRLTTNSRYGVYSPVEQYYTFWVGKWIEKLYLRILNAVGVPGNIAAFITIMRLKPISSPSLFIAFLAVIDTMALVLMLVFHEMGRKRMSITHYGCRFQIFLGTTLLMLSNWTLVCLTVERFVAVWFPLKVNRICHKKNTAVLLCLLITFFLLLDTHFLFGTEESVTPFGIPYCRSREEFTYFHARIWYYIDFVFFAFIPCLVLIVFNALIVCKIKNSFQLQQEITSNQKQQQDKVKQQRQMTIMLSVVSIVFIILILPNGIYFIYKNYWKISTPKERALFLFVTSVISCLSTANHAVNFYFYFLMAPKFRNKFLKLFLCGKLRKYVYKSSSISTASNLSTTDVSSVSLSLGSTNHDVMTLE